MAANQFIPNAYTEKLTKWMTEQSVIFEATRRLERQKRYDEIPPDPAEVAAYEAFAARWEALTAEGIERGLVDRVFDRDYGDEIGVTLAEPPAASLVLVWTEPDDDFQARTGVDPNAPVTIQFTGTQ